MIFFLDKCARKRYKPKPLQWHGTTHWSDDIHGDHIIWSILLPRACKKRRPGENSFSAISHASAKRNVERPVKD